jgi:catechol 2,3-dioxygenase-like lactoylglutathione lyase family enzyme
VSALFTEGWPRVEAVGFTVSHMERSVRFYCDALHCVPESDLEVSGPQYARLVGLSEPMARVVRLRLGSESIELTEYLTPRGRPVPPDLQSHDRAFQHLAVVVADMERAHRHLREWQVRFVSDGPQRLPEWNFPVAGIEAFYFRDPDGHPLELITFPPDKGDPRWQQPDNRLFLGIDHTAVVVADTEASLAFYRDVLGLSVAGESENRGLEQERLAKLSPVRVRVTSLRAAAGPGVELLEYLEPGGGRDRPADLRPNDLAHWRTRLAVPSAALAAQRLRAPAPAEFADVRIGYRRAFLAADPDGHALEFVET